MARLNVNDARCEALFASGLQRSDAPAAEAVTQAISRTVRQLGIRGCASQMAQEFGDHPEPALERMRWARQLVGEISASAAPPLAGRGGPAAGRYGRPPAGQQRAGPVAPPDQTCSPRALLPRLRVPGRGISGLPVAVHPAAEPASGEGACQAGHEPEHQDQLDEGEQEPAAAGNQQRR